MASNIISTKQTIAEINEILSKNITLLNQGAESFTKYAQSHKLPSEYVNSLRNIDENQKKIVKSQKDLMVVEKEIQRQRLSDLKLAKDREKAFDKYDRQLKREEAQQARNIQRQNEANRAFVKLNKERTEAAKRLQDLIAAGNTNNKVLQQAQIEFNKLDARVRKANNAVRDGRMDVGRYHLATQGLISTLRNLMGAFGLTSGVFLFAQALRNGIQTIKDFDGGLKDVSKTTGLTGADLESLGEDVISLSEKLRVVGVKSLLEYATVAGQLGVKGRENILNFSEALALLETASDITGEEGGRNIARLLTIVDGGVENVNDFADEIVRLGNNFAATEAEILDNATAIAQNTGQYRLGRKEVLAYATATKAVGLESEITGSTIGRTIAILEEAAITGKNMAQITNLLGLSQEELGKRLKENAGQVFTDFIFALNKVDEQGGSVTATLNELGQTAVRDRRVISSLATGGFDVLTRALNDVNNASGAALQEFETASTKISLAWSRVTNAFDRFILSLEDGNNFIGTSVIKIFDEWSKRIDTVSFFLNNQTSLLDKWKFGINNAGKTLTFGLIKPYEESIDKLKKETEERQKNAASIQDQINKYVEANGSLAPLVKTMEEYNNLLFDVSENDITSEQAGTVGFLRTQISELNKAIEESAKSDIEGIRAKQEKIKALQAELDAILGVTKATEKSNEIKKGSIAFYEQLISNLEKEQKQLATNSREYNVYQQAIDDARIKLEMFERSLGSVIDKNLKAKGIKLTFDTPDITTGDVPTDVTGPTGAETYEETWRETFQTVADLASQTSGIIAQFSQQAFNAQFEELARQREEALTFAGESAEAQLAVEQQFNERRKEIQRQQAEAQKRQAIFDIIINTASAVVRALGQGGPALAAIVGALGAAQLALVASTPIPQFWEGGVVGSEQKIMVNDDPYGKKGANYREVIEKPNGQILTPQGKNVKMTVPKGTIVHPTYDAFMNSLNMELLSNNIMPVGMGDLNPMIVNNGLSKDEIMDVMNVHAGKIVSTINKQHGININIDENGISKYVTKKGVTSKIMNARFSGKGRKV